MKISKEFIDKSTKPNYYIKIEIESKDADIIYKKLGPIILERAWED